MVSNRRVLFLYKLEINRIERIYRFKRGVDFVYLIEGSDKAQAKIKRRNTPHLSRYGVWEH